jgi:hypothetical protein
MIQSFFFERERVDRMLAIDQSGTSDGVLLVVDSETGIDEMRPAFHPAGAYGVKYCC